MSKESELSIKAVRDWNKATHPTRLTPKNSKSLWEYFQAQPLKVFSEAPLRLDLNKKKKLRTLVQPSGVWRTTESLPERWISYLDYYEWPWLCLFLPSLPLEAITNNFCVFISLDIFVRLCDTLTTIAAKYSPWSLYFYSHNRKYFPITFFFGANGKKRGKNVKN